MIVVVRQKQSAQPPSRDGAKADPSVGDARQDATAVEMIWMEQVAPELSVQCRRGGRPPQDAEGFDLPEEAATGGLKPYLHVRRDLWAKVTRTLFFDLVELGEEREVEGSAMFGVTSMGVFFPMAPAEQVRDFA